MIKRSLLLLLYPLNTFAATINYEWNIGWVTASPDGFSRQVIGINGQWPCPVIEGSVGDTVTIVLKNNLDESTGLHFHGINQKGTQVMDGPSGVTQCPIPPGAEFTYTFILDAPGTYWYHSHNSGQYPDGLRGPLIVKDPNDPYAGKCDEELLLTTSDWYHDKVPVLVQQLLSPSNTQFLPPFPDSILVNDTNQAKFYFTPGNTYKLRIISMAAFASTFLEFDGHVMNVIEVDGSSVEPYTATQIRVAPAQRYTVLITAVASNAKNYAFLASLDINPDFANDPAPTYSHNITGYIVYDESQANPPPLEVASWVPADDSAFSALDGQALWQTPDKSITLDFNFGLDAQGIPRAYFNNITYVTQKVPSLFTAFTTGSQNSDPTIYGTVNPFVVKSGDIVEIVVNNRDAAIHPFHLHGHQFQVAARPASNSGDFNGATANFPSIPMRRDTVTVNANSYVVIRYKADNPGVWLFHCHIEWHVVMGLIATIIEAPEELQGLPVPQEHQAICNAQHLPTSGNAAGNTQNLTDLTGANTTPLNPNATGSNYTYRISGNYERRRRNRRPMRLPAFS